MRRFIAAAGAIGLSVGLIGTGAGAASAAEGDRRAVCEHRVCLLVLDESNDNDGDGVTDVDEEALGSDPNDAGSYPDVHKIFDAAIARELPSFEEHLTELVVLPRDTPDGMALATGVGALDRPEEGPLVRSAEGLLGKLRANGFEHLGRDATVVLAEEPTLREDQKLAFSVLGNVAVWGVEGDSIEGLVGVTNLGPNGLKKPARFVDGGFTHGGAPGSFGRGYSVAYSDGSSDNVRIVTETKTSVTSVGETTSVTTGTITNLAYDSDLNFVGGGTTDYSETFTSRDDGFSTWETSSSTTNYNSDGQITDKTDINVKENADGTTTTKTKTEEYDSNGNVTKTTESTTVDDGETATTTTTTTTYKDGKVESTETKKTCKGADCPEDGGETGMVNPDYLATGPITADDLARVVVRFNSNRTPSEDDYGQIDIRGIEPPSNGLGPLILTVNTDGVVVLASGFQPEFNGATPEYDPDLQDLIDISGVTPPDNTGPISWPGI
ncbi:thrombospondin type 3 repeat-containing protein [Micromonospora sp. B11E3]|uniref:thrombospondin type 3 repeat-containing protein n=1 Tax=Micromonospora sp. B11E3 TaxID=3153562 RepID=UPI00325DB940